MAPFTVSIRPHIQEPITLIRRPSTGIRRTTTGIVTITGIGGPITIGTIIIGIDVAAIGTQARKRSALCPWQLCAFGQDGFILLAG
jgi:hypothetical protein